MEAPAPGRPPLTERRKAATRLEIAREAVRLFTAKGVAATSAEEIASAAGISVRTLWRYFPAKERCVMPLLSTGIDLAARSLRTWAPGRGMAEFLDELDRAAGELRGDQSAVLALVRLTRTEQALRAVWLQAHDDAEPAFAEALARRAGLARPDLACKVRAAMFNATLRAAVEHHAFGSEPAGADGLLDAVRSALRILARGLPDLDEPGHRSTRADR